MEGVLNKLLGAAIALTTFSAETSVFAADLAPLYKAPSPAAIIESGFYAWMDDSFQRVNLPTQALGFKNVGEAGLTFPAGGAVQSFDPHLNGFGVNGGFGYHFPVVPVRLQVDASYVKAEGNATQTAFNTAPDLFLQLANGTSAPAGAVFRCHTDVSCTTAGQLKSSYNSWQVDGKTAYDWKSGSVTLSPSAALFGGASRSNQVLSQSFTQPFLATGLIADQGQYASNSSLNWTDFGGRLGLDGSVAANNWLSVDFGGSLGLANRTASLSVADSGSFATGAGATIFSGASAVTIGATTTAFLANAEAGLAIKPTPSVVLRGFVGLRYDSKVPGVSAPIFSGDAIGVRTSGPAGIYFAQETSYYAGGGLIVSLGGPVVSKY